jgi:GGDEF domain-containing protein
MSIGIAIYPKAGMDEGSLLKNADFAMYQAKQAGRARYHLSKKT